MTHSSTRARRFLIFASLALTLTFTQQAAAELVLGVDSGVGLAQEGEGVASGWGVRLGYDLGVPLLRVASEARVQWMTLEEPGDPSLISARLGLRVGVDGLISPSLYGHLGYATVGAQAPAWSYDMGASLDLRLFPVVSVGLWGGVQGLDADLPGLERRWWEGGLQAEIAF